VRDEGIELQVIGLPEVKKGFVLSPRRRVVEHSLRWLNRLRRPLRDFAPKEVPLWNERLPETLPGLHFVVLAMLVLVHAVPIVRVS